MSTDHATELHHPVRDELQLGEVLHALSDPVRLQIVQVLDRADGEVACGQFPLPVGKSTASHHFKVLREAGVVHERHEGTRRLHALRIDDLDARFPGLLATVLRAAAR
ncbi:MAG: Helix-turn-helix domain protein [Acidimicrobiales bacterium]|jgi:DNA-binding transcriptional ArsR family regulator|nr:Helix-turn-helix domain protein [Acidimicrobiales bacterium]